MLENSQTRPRRKNPVWPWAKAFSAASSLAGREILVTLPLTALVYLPFRWVRRRIYSE